MPRQIASISKSITNNNPRLLSGASCQGKGGGGGRQERHCLPTLVTTLPSSSHTKPPSRISCPGWLCFHPRCCKLRQALLRRASQPQAGSREAGSGERKAGSGWGCSIASLPCRFTSGQAAAQQWELADREGEGRLILASM